MYKEEIEMKMPAEFEYSNKRFSEYLNRLDDFV